MLPLIIIIIINIIIVTNHYITLNLLKKNLNTFFEVSGQF